MSVSVLSGPLPTVADALAIPELVEGEPELVAGRAGLDRAIRWAHVVAGREAAALLDGGELVLTTGAGWPEERGEPAELDALVSELVDSEPAAIVFELGTRFDEAPTPLVRACEAAGVPLIVLHRIVRFVQITQRVHQRVLADQREALEARAEVHAMLTELGLNRSPVDYVVDRIAATLGAPVVLEDAGHRVVAWSGPESSVLEPWAEAQRGPLALAPSPPEGSTRVAVEAQGTRWGSLTALPGPDHPAGRETVLELGAFALALARLADREGDQWIELGSKRLIDAVLEGRYSGERELANQLEAAGLPLEGRVLVGATLTGVGDFGASDPLEAAVLGSALRAAIGRAGRVLISAGTGSETGSSSTGSSSTGSSVAAIGRVLESSDRGDRANRAGRAARHGAVGRTLLALLSLPVSANGSPERELGERLANELEARLPTDTPPSWCAELSLGVQATRPQALIASLEGAVAASRARRSDASPHGLGEALGARSTASRFSHGRVIVQFAEQRPLAYLIRGLAGAPALQEFAADTLDPLLAHDRASGTGHSGDLERVLAAYLAHPTNRSLAAQRARLSRSVFYQRIALIEELLGVDLADGETIAALTVALLARGTA